MSSPVKLCGGSIIRDKSLFEEGVVGRIPGGSEAILAELFLCRQTQAMLHVSDIFKM